MLNTTRAVISGAGPDRPGIVAAIGKILYKHGCNIEDSTMTRLANEFAVILIVAVPKDVSWQEFAIDLSGLERSHGVSLMLKPMNRGTSDTPASKQPYLISVSGQDRAGLTYEITQVLADLEINITDLNAQIISGEDGPVYIMMLEVDLPGGFTISQLEREMQVLAERMQVEINLRALESVPL